MPYIICDNENYLCQKHEGYSIVDNINQATKWDKITKANNVCDALNRGKNFNNYHLEVKFTIQENKVVYEPAKHIELTYNILDKIKEFKEFASQIEERRLYLQSALQEIELNIVDIEHAAEFYKLNAAQGYKIYKLLHEARVNRREIKRELEEISLSLGTPIKSLKLKNLEQSIIGLDNKKYTPRINKELFGV